MTRGPCPGGVGGGGGDSNMKMTRCVCQESKNVPILNDTFLNILHTHFLGYYQAKFIYHLLSLIFVNLAYLHIDCSVPAQYM